MAAAFVGLCLLVAAASGFVHAAGAAEGDERSTAVVLRVKPALHVRFQTQRGLVVETDTLHAMPGARVGEQIVVAYDPAKPWRATQSRDDVLALPMTTAVASIMLLTVAARGLRHLRDRPLGEAVALPPPG